VTGDRGVVKSVRGGKIMVATTFLATIKKNLIFTMRVKMFRKIGVRVCFGDRNDFFLAC
jgi:hypothetical protein